MICKEHVFRGPGLLQSLFCRLRRQGKREMRGHLALRKGASRPLDPRFARFIPDFATALFRGQGNLKVAGASSP